MNIQAAIQEEEKKVDTFSLSRQKKYVLNTEEFLLIL